jgi:hypothetical protein
MMPPHHLRVHRVVTRNNNASFAIEHRHVLSLADNPQASFFEGSNGDLVIDSREPRH